MKTVLVKCVGGKKLFPPQTLIGMPVHIYDADYIVTFDEDNYVTRWLEIPDTRKDWE